MGNTKIPWAEKVWNPITGCTKISPGCQNCYAERMANRLRGRCGYPADEPFRVTLHPDRLEEPLRWRKPSMVFVCSMGDLFHEDVPFEFINRVFTTIGQCQQHIFIILTKRPERMKVFIEDYYAYESPGGDEKGVHIQPNVWLGVTAENQKQADKRIPVLIQIPAAVRFVSVEPMLEAVDLLNDDYLGGCIYCEICLEESPKTCIERDAKLDWVICGGESGPNARPMHPDWARNLRDQCQAAGVPFFFKQWGEWLPNMQEYGCYQENANYNSRHIHIDKEGRDITGLYGLHGEGDAVLCRVGKKSAGDLLDGKQYHEFPEVTA